MAHNVWLGEDEVITENISPNVFIFIIIISDGGSLVMGNWGPRNGFNIFANFSYCTFTKTDPFYNFARPYVRTFDVNIMNQVLKNILNKTNELK